MTDPAAQIGETLLSNALAGALRDRGFEHVWDPATKTLTVTPKGGDAHATRAEAVLQRTGLDATAPLDTSTSEAHFQSAHVEGVVKIVEEAISAGEPLMIAWKAYQQTKEWANTRHWARHSEHVEYSLWAAFEAGFRAALEDKL